MATFCCPTELFLQCKGGVTHSSRVGISRIGTVPLSPKSELLGRLEQKNNSSTSSDLANEPLLSCVLFVFSLQSRRNNGNVRILIAMDWLKLLDLFLSSKERNDSFFLVATLSI